MPAGQRVREIVAATDFSATAERGLSWAGSLARRHEARLHLAHSVFWAASPIAQLEGSQDLVEEIMGQARSRLAERAMRLAESGVSTEVHVGVGQAAESVLRVAGKVGADVVVVGTRGLTGFEHLLLGSTAERIVQGARCPVLSVHPEDPREPRQPKVVLVPTDFSADAEQAAAQAVRIFGGAAARARLLLLHVHDLPGDYAAFGPVGPTPMWQHYRAAAEPALHRQLEGAAAPLLRDGLRVETALREGHAASAILEEAREREVDLIAMGTYGRTGLSHLLMGSTAERVVQHASCPVLTARQSSD